LRILYISPRQCWPASNGARLREFHFLRALGSRWDVTYLYLEDPAGPKLTAADLPFCREIIGVPKPVTYGLFNLARGIAGRWPLPVLNYGSKDMRAAVESALRKRDYDLVHLDSIHMVRAESIAGSSRCVYNWHNIESEVMERYSQSERNQAKAWYARRTAKKMETLERSILASARGHVVCSERERDRLRLLAPAARIEVVENGVDTASFSPAAAPGSALVFVGTMDYFPNVDAAVSFARGVWPKVRQQFPHLTLAIVGANPAEAVRALADVDGVTVTGTVPDVRPYYRDAFAAIVPLRSGGGTRLKILEAMAAGVPVISSTLGAEGLAVSPHREILIADPDRPEEWVRSIASLFLSPEQRARIIEAARSLVVGRYDWEVVGRRLADLYLSWSGKTR
jgi:sugar transferase (PEP-CTERM/EpsH1 system associated)